MSRRAGRDAARRCTNSPRAVRDYLRLLLGGRQQEVFWRYFSIPSIA
jgi:hypothetical protein